MIFLVKMRSLIVICSLLGASSLSPEILETTQFFIQMWIEQLESESIRMSSSFKSMESELNRLRQIACVDPVRTDPSLDLIDVLDDVWKKESFEAMILRLENYDGDASCAYIDYAIRRSDRDFTDLKLKIDAHDKRLDFAREFDLVLLETLEEDPSGQSLQDFIETRLLEGLADWYQEFRDQNQGNIVARIFMLVVSGTLAGMAIRDVLSIML
jgi:hypothetical protein